MIPIRISAGACRGFISILGASLMAVALPQVSFAQSDPLIGAWRQNLAKSTFNPGPGPQTSNTIVIQPDGQGLKLTNERSKLTATMIYDSEPHPVTGAAAWDAIAIKRVDAYTQQWTLFKDGRAVENRTLVISRDGKIATETESGLGNGGRQVDNVTVWEKQ